MALPTGPIDLVAFDDLIEVAWGNSVAQSLNNLKERREQQVWAPPSEILAPATAAPALPAELPNWFRMGGASPLDITIPDWATTVIATVLLNGARDPTDNTAYAVQVKLGTEFGRRIRQTGRNGYFGVIWGSEFNVAGIAGDTVGVWIGAGRLSGSGQWRVDGDSDVAITFDFGGAIG